MMLSPKALPSLQLLAGPSTAAYPPVTAWIVVMRPSTIPQLSLTTLAKGARQLVVQEALDTTSISLVYVSWLTPITKVGDPSLDGADMITFEAPPARCPEALSVSKKTPVDSHTKLAPVFPHGMSAGFNSLDNKISYPLTRSPFSVADTVPSNLP